MEHWDSFHQFIEVANDKCDWLVLRNFEYLPNDFFEHDKDIDILCSDIALFVDTMKLEKRSWGISSYEVMIDNKIIPVDIRFLGDGYYDKLWQYKMLKNKTYTKENVPRMNNLDYFYSLIYHSKIQKNEVKGIYIERFYRLSKILNIENYQKESILDDKYIANLLSRFMEVNHYTYVHSLDINVPKNIIFFNLLSHYARRGVEFKTPIQHIILKYIPNFVFRLIPQVIKTKIKDRL